MAEYDELAMAAEAAGNEIFWLGPASGHQVQRLEALLGLQLSPSYKRFLEVYGGGGIVSAEISGIEDDNAELMTGGSVLGDTFTCRDRFGLPDHLVVIYFHDDEVCWCLDASEGDGDEFPVVSYNIFSKEVDRAISEDFSAFMRQHLALYST
ncbi:SMI1/KNR4 family protein [Achromobacter sp. MFA1 R4]|uniref:SMI1/KNR4 family protein n=1 Tax=Achromobacter sp. MFA1 R4 TaxID=1881016 RepID=UPI0009710776|nr:SMI1/KNR4 family protein [Achromobacter sp. MFA1 R4]